MSGEHLYMGIEGEHCGRLMLFIFRIFTLCVTPSKEGPVHGTFPAMCALCGKSTSGRNVTHKTHSSKKTDHKDFKWVPSLGLDGYICMLGHTWLCLVYCMCIPQGWTIRHLHQVIMNQSSSWVPGYWIVFFRLIFNSQLLRHCGSLLTCKDCNLFLLAGSRVRLDLYDYCPC